MKQVLQNYRTGSLTLEEVPAPACLPGNVLVRNHASLISSGTERAMIELARKGLLGKSMARPDLFQQALDKARREGYWKTFWELLARMDEPSRLGYSSAGVVLELGPAVDDLRAGDRVACFGAGYAAHAEIVRVPHNLCIPIPDGVDFDEASFSMIGGIALHGVRTASVDLGAWVGVVGLGLIGLLTVQLLRAAGCHVVGVDLEPDKVARALELDVEAAYGADGPWVEAVQALTRGSGLDAILVTAATEDARLLQSVLPALRPNANLVMVGTGKIELPRQAMWEKEIRFVVSRATGPGSLDPQHELHELDYPVGFVRWTQRRNVAEFLTLLQQRRVRVRPLITHRFPIERALEAYDLIAGGQGGVVGVQLEYSGTAPPIRKISLGATGRVAVRPQAGTVTVGVIGAGLIARTVLLPELARQDGVRLRGIASLGGLSARHLGMRFRFDYATTDVQEILADPEVNCVFILTRHDSHGVLIQKAWEAGKAVYVEKPLVLTEEELRDVYAAWQRTHGFLMVGFNRRYAPLAIEAASFLPAPIVPRLIHCRVNAGTVPARHWVNDQRQGGGRILSEVCHFVDLAQYWAGALPTSVFAECTPTTNHCLGGAGVSVTLKFANGSLATILYATGGPKSYSRERFEIFSGERAVELQDFRRLRKISQGRRRARWRWNQDLGYRNELRALLDALGSGRSGVSFAEYAAGALATFGILRALRQGTVQQVALEELEAPPREESR